MTDGKRKEKVFLDYLPTRVSRVIQNVITPIAYKMKRKSMLEFYTRFVKPGDLVFDIGAFEGYIADVFLELGAKVIAVEPLPACFAKLEKKFARSDDVTLVNKGVSSTTGELAFHVNSKFPMICTFSDEFITEGRYSFGKWDRQITVPVTTLQALVDEFGTPAFAKIDVEGHEWPVIQGLHSKIPCLTYEFHREFLDDAKKCATHLAGLAETRFNFDLDVAFKPPSDAWLTVDELFATLDSLAAENETLKGDIIVTMA